MLEIFEYGRKITFHFVISLNKQGKKTSVNVTLEFGLWQLTQCEMLLTVSSVLM